MHRSNQTLNIPPSPPPPLPHRAYPGHLTILRTKVVRHFKRKFFHGRDSLSFTWVGWGKLNLKCLSFFFFFFFFFCLWAYTWSLVQGEIVVSNKQYSLARKSINKPFAVIWKVQIVNLIKCERTSFQTVYTKNWNICFLGRAMYRPI